MTRRIETTVHQGKAEKSREILKASRGISASRGVTNARPNTLRSPSVPAKRDQRQTLPETEGARRSSRRASRVARGQPQPLRYRQNSQSQAAAAGSIQGTWGKSFKLAKMNSPASWPASFTRNPTKTARMTTGIRRHRRIMSGLSIVMMATQLSSWALREQVLDSLGQGRAEVFRGDIADVTQAHAAGPIEHQQRRPDVGVERSARGAAGVIGERQVVTMPAEELDRFRRRVAMVGRRVGHRHVVGVESHPAIAGEALVQTVDLG